MAKDPETGKKIMTEAQLANLRKHAAKKGEVRNPKGRPPEPKVLKMKLAEFLGEEGLDVLFNTIRETDNDMARIKGIEFVAKYVLQPIAKQIDIDVKHSTFGDLLASVAKARAELGLDAKPVQVIEAEVVEVKKPLDG